MVDCPYCSRADDGVQKVMGTATPPPVPAAPPTELAPASPMRATVVDGYTAHFRTPPGATVVDGVAADTPSPRPAGDIPLQGWLVVMSGAAKFRDLRLDRERLVIGSGPGSDLRLEETGVAPCHARVVKERDGVYLVGADGAVFLNNSQQPSLRHPLADEDLFKIGSVYLKYRRL